MGRMTTAETQTQPPRQRRYNAVEDMFPLDEAVAARCAADDAAWFRRSPLDFRVRPFQPGEAIFVLAATREPLAALVLRLRRVHAVCLISRPDPADRLDPWLSVGGDTFCRARDMVAGVRRMMEEGATGKTLDAYLPDRTAELFATRPRDPRTLLRDASETARLALRQIFGGGFPAMRGTVFDEIALDMMWDAFDQRDDGEAPDGRRPVGCLQRWQVWSQIDRPYFRPDGALIDRLLDPNLLLDDSVPLAIPFSVCVADVSGRPDLFDGGDGHAPPSLVGLHRVRRPNGPVGDAPLPGAIGRKSVAEISADDAQVVIDHGASLCSSAEVRYFGVGDRTESTFGAPQPAPTTWSEWRAWALSLAADAPVLSRVALLLSGLSYVMVTQPRFLRPSEPRRTKRPAEALETDRIRCLDVPDVASLERSPEPIFRPSESSRGPLDKAMLMLTRTTRREYVVRAPCGPGKRESRPVVVPEQPVLRWTSLDTLLRQHVCPDLSVLLDDGPGGRRP